MSENVVNIGDILQSLRIYKGINKVELAEEICSIEELDLIERNMQAPTIDQLFKFANKLNIQLSDLFNFATADTVSYVSAVNGLIERYKRDRNYRAINEIVQREKENPLFNFPSGKQYLLWHEAICLYYLSESEKEAMETSVNMLYKAIEITNPSRKGLTEREIEIKMSIALIEKDEKNFEKAIIILKEVLEDIDHLPTLTEPRVRLRALFGLSQSLSRLGLYQESLVYSEKGIDQCINDEVLYLLGEFFYQSGINNIQIGDVHSATKFLTKSLQLFNIQENKNLGNVVEDLLEKLAIQ